MTKSKNNTMVGNSFLVPFVASDGKKVCELMMTSIPHEGASFTHTDGKTYQIIKVDGNREKNDYKCMVVEYVGVN